jgi:hypothetical protein
VATLPGIEHSVIGQLEVHAAQAAGLQVKTLTDWLCEEDDLPFMAPLFPDDAEERKTYPVFKGLLDYFPNACAAVANHSFVGNEQHNAGEEMHWAKEKSIGSGDQIVRHLMEGHLEAMAWRALELLERKLTGLPPFEEQSND